MPSKHFSGNIARPDETWVRGRGTNSETVVRKATVRVAKGVTGSNRPGTFRGATNYRGTERPVQN